MGWHQGKKNIREETENRRRLILGGLENMHNYVLNTE